jgi:hypothetical protein
MKPYSIDLRVQVLSALDTGMPHAETAGSFQVILGTIKRWLRLRRLSSDLPPQRPTDCATTITPNQQPLLRAQLDATPDAALTAL